MPLTLLLEVVPYIRWVNQARQQFQNSHFGSKEPIPHGYTQSTVQGGERKYGIPGQVASGAPDFGSALAVAPDGARGLSRSNLASIRLL